MLDVEKMLQKTPQEFYLFIHEFDKKDKIALKDLAFEFNVRITIMTTSMNTKCTALKRSLKKNPNHAKNQLLYNQLRNAPKKLMDFHQITLTKIKAIDDSDWDHLSSTQKQDIRAFKEQLKYIPEIQLTHSLFVTIKTMIANYLIQTNNSSVEKNQIGILKDDTRSIARINYILFSFMLDAFEERLSTHRLTHAVTLPQAMRVDVVQFKEKLVMLASNEEEIGFLQFDYKNGLDSIRNRLTTLESRFKETPHYPFDVSFKATYDYLVLLERKHIISITDIDLALTRAEIYNSVTKSECSTAPSPTSVIASVASQKNIANFSRFSHKNNQSVLFAPTARKEANVSLPAQVVQDIGCILC